MRLPHGGCNHLSSYALAHLSPLGRSMDRLEKGAIVIYSGTMYRGTVMVATVDRWGTNDPYKDRTPGGGSYGPEDLCLKCPPAFSNQTYFWVPRGDGLPQFCGGCEYPFIGAEDDYLCAFCRNDLWEPFLVAAD